MPTASVCSFRRFFIAVKRCLGIMYVMKNAMQAICFNSLKVHKQNKYNLRIINDQQFFVPYEENGVNGGCVKPRV